MKKIFSKKGEIEIITPIIEKLKKDYPHLTEEQIKEVVEKASKDTIDEMGKNVVQKSLDFMKGQR